jgi:hypothetical protein
MEKDKDYYIIVKNGVEFRVMTEEYLAKRGWCCGNNCLHCAYSPKAQKGNTNLREDVKRKVKDNLK